MTVLRCRVLACVLTAVAVLFGLPAWAKKDKQLMKDNHGMEAHMFRAAVDTKGHFTTDATPILPHMAISLGLMLDFGFHDWVAVELDDKKEYEKTWLKNYIDSRLMFNWGLFDLLVIGFQIPIAIPSGQVYSRNLETGELDPDAWSTKGGIGDIVFHSKQRWLRADRHVVGLGTMVAYQAPSGKPEFLLSDGHGGAFAGKLIIDVEPISWYRFAINGGVHLPLGAHKENHLSDKTEEGENDTDPRVPIFDFGLNPRDVSIPITLFKYGPMFTFSFGQSFTIWPQVLDFVVELYGTQLMSDFTNTDYFSMEACAGFKLFVERNSYLMAGYTHGIPASDTPSGYGFQAMEHRLFIGFAFEPSIGDRDGDGIKDDVDQCPDDPEDRDDFEDSDGCPDPDNDRDGILDVEDDCPLVPEDKDGDQDQDGCPERSANDRDGDGILDDVDQCPDDPEDIDQFQDKDGCPDPDNDGDGILDVDDLCPNEPEDMDGFNDADGCPDPDNDSDRIPDVNDSCPNEPETYNGKDDEDGCPDQGDVVLTGTDIMILKKVYFEYDSAVIKPVSYDILDAVAATIINNPQIDIIEVQGHADERGNDKYNLRLTTDRAAAVVTYLIKKKVNRKKLRSVGYGEYCPMDPAQNEAAYEKNRRVEFKVISIDGHPTGVEAACKRARDKGIGVFK